MDDIPGDPPAPPDIHHHLETAYRHQAPIPVSDSAGSRTIDGDFPEIRPAIPRYHSYNRQTMDLDKRLFAILPDHKPGSQTVDGFETTLANTRCAGSGPIYGVLRKICSAALERYSTSLQAVDGETEPLPTPPDHYRPRQTMDCDEVHHPTPADANAGVEGIHRLQIDLSAHIHSGLI